jgi:hypothetical protein
MKNLKHIFLAVFSLSIASSCSNFEQLNIDPNQPATVSPDMIVTQVLKDSYKFGGNGGFEVSYANVFCKHTTLCETPANADQYYYSNYPFGGFGSYKRLTDLKKMVEFAKGNPAESSYKGLALFMKASYGFSATLSMGDVPYSEAGMAEEGITRPKYDKQADVFAAVLKDFQDAEVLFAAGKNFGGDIMYNGNATKWRKLCNAMQLKVIQTMSKKATAEQKARFAAIVSANNLMASNLDNFQLVYTNNSNARHPFYNSESRRPFIAVSKLMVDELRNMQDRRLFYFAEPAPYLIKAGKLASDFDAYEGAPTQLSANTLSVNNNKTNGKYSVLNKRYPFLSTAGDPMLKFTYSEQCFIIAEAIEEGWVAGDAKAYYENGVKAILNYYMTLAAGIGTHNDGTTAVPIIVNHSHGSAITTAYINGYFTGAAAYATAGTKADRLHQIWVQRWFLDFFQTNGLNYPQFLRTGYPLFPLDPTTSMNPDDKTVYPKRWKYPTSEQVSNPDNYKTAINSLGGYDGINVVPWYLQ